MEKKIALSLKNIDKIFYGSYALKNINLDFYEGEVHILCGENGAGKSTLMKILSGLYMRDHGEITLYGQPYNVKQPREAEELGIVTVYQEFNLSPTISVAENIFLHREPGKFMVDRKKLNQEAQKYLDMIGCKISPSTKVSNLSTANQQMVQIAKALSQKARILILDEPCASITEADTDRLFELIRKLKKDGLTILYIDHRIENFKKIGDRVSVLRDGEYIGTVDIEEMSKEEIIKMMVGRSLEAGYVKQSKPQEEILLEVKHYSNKKLKDVSFSVRKGEVFGLAGLVGAGRTEVVEALFGLDPKGAEEETLIHGKPVKIKSPRDAIKNGIAFIPEDRKIKGFVPERSIDFNLVLTSIMDIGKGGFVDTKLEKKLADEQREGMQIHSMGKNAHVRELSGGNQQKVVLGKWLMRDDIELFLMDEPTRGIDVGVKLEIYKLIDALASAGKSVILITSEMPELISMCDRIATLADGRMTGLLERKEFSQETILSQCV